MFRNALYTLAHVPIVCFRVVSQTSWGLGWSASWKCSQRETNVWLFTRENIFISEVALFIMNLLKCSMLSNIFKAQVQSTVTADGVCELSPVESTLKTCVLFFVIILNSTFVWFDRDDSHPQLLTHKTSVCCDSGCKNWFQEVCRFGQGKRDFSLGLAANLLSMLTAIVRVCLCACGSSGTQSPSQPHDWKLKLLRFDRQRVCGDTELSEDNAVLAADGRGSDASLLDHSKDFDWIQIYRLLSVCQGAGLLSWTKSWNARCRGCKRCCFCKHFIAALFLRTFGIFISWLTSFLLVISLKS